MEEITEETSLRLEKLLRQQWKLIDEAFLHVNRRLDNKDYGKSHDLDSTEVSRAEKVLVKEKSSSSCELELASAMNEDLILSPAVPSPAISKLNPPAAVFISSDVVQPSLPKTLDASIGLPDQSSAMESPISSILHLEISEPSATTSSPSSAPCSPLQQTLQYGSSALAQPMQSLDLSTSTSIPSSTTSSTSCRVFVSPRAAHLPA